MRRWGLVVVAVAATAVGTAAGARTDSPTRASAYSWLGLAQDGPAASWRPYSPSSPFNRPFTAADRVLPRSRTIVDRVLSWNGGAPADLVFGRAGTRDDYDHPIYFAKSTDPVYRLVPTRPWGRNSLRGLRVRVPAAARPAGGGDAHLAVIEPDGREVDLWGVQSKPAHGGSLRFAWGGQLRIDGDGLGSAATATHIGSAAGVIRAGELAAGHIDHALALVVRCTAPGGSFGFGERRSSYRGGSAYVYPASSGASACGGGGRSAPPAGARFRLDLDVAQIAAFADQPAKRAVLEALARYGAYVVDTGGPGFGFLLESSSSFTSLGRKDPLVSLGAAEHLPRSGPLYRLDLGEGVDWRAHLRVMTPPSR